MENSELLAALDARFDRIDARFELMDARFEARLKEAIGEIRVLIEGQGKWIQLVGEGVKNANDRLERLQTDVGQHFSEVRSFNDFLFQHLDRRLQRIEGHGVR